MEVSVEGSDGIPPGSILSVRAGSIRKQGSLHALKGMKFGTNMLESCPFTVDLLVPLASKRVILRPDSEHYVVDFGVEGQPMHVDLRIQEPGGPDGVKIERPTHSRQQRREKQMGDCNTYVNQHRLVQFMQNLMQSILIDRPEDPYKYMEGHLMAANAPKPAPVPVAQPQRKSMSEPQKEVMTAQPRGFAGAAFSQQNADGALAEPRLLQSEDLVPAGVELRRLQYCNLGDTFPTRSVGTPLRGMVSNFLSDSYVTEALISSGEQGRKAFYDMLCAGPKESLHFNPSDVVATIVTCGGLCPGLNSVVRQVVQTLYTYGVRKIYGIRGGYKGVIDPQAWLELTPDVVQDIHDLGGTILASDRGNPPVEDQVKVLREMGVRQHFVIGGDGTHRGADATSEAMRKSGWECSVVGIPKTIDNDIPMLDRTFGFDTACTEAAKAIHAAYTEATCNANCIGLVKLMGRHCGFIAMHACLSARYVDICLIPEMEISTEKLLTHCTELLQTKGHAVIVVAEGCGNTLMQSSGDVDAGGNVKLADVGPWLRDKITERFKEVKLPVTIKYIDPTYMIRAVKPNANDSVYCAVLGENAVHAAMAGYTGVTLGKVSDRYVVLPMQAITRQKPKRVNLAGRWFVRLLSTTMQPDLTLDGFTMSLPPSPVHGADPDPMLEISVPVQFEEVVGSAGEIRRLELEHLGDAFGRKEVPTAVHTRVKGGNLRFLGDNCWITQTLGNRNNKNITCNLQMQQAGPRAVLHFEPEEVAAAIVTCGGLCPGLNSVIREIVMMLYAYGVKKVYGIKGGFKGVTMPQTWLTLTPKNVKDIHMQGGTILVSDRGAPHEDEMAKALREKGIRQYFVIGGDGTHRGAYATYEGLKAINWECSVIGVPKTIDNDISLLDRTFGFDSACSEAVRSINSAYVEATCNANCIGLVKLMGRHCGYLTMMSVLAARYVDICLLPEMDVSLEKVLEHCVQLMKTQGYAVIVVAEGCGETLLQSTGEKDAGGNAKMADAGVWLKDTILSHFKSLKLPLTIKYLDPTYNVRAIPANANDSIYCSILAQAGVHAAMAGYTGVTVAKVNNSYVYLPIRTITGMPNRAVDVTGQWYEKLLAATGQPNLSNAGSSTAVPDDPWIRKDWQVRHRTGSGFEDTALDVVKVPDTKFSVIDGYGEPKSVRALQRADILGDYAQVRKLKCFHLSERFGTFKLPSPLNGKSTQIFQDGFSWTSQSMCRGLPRASSEPYFQMVRGGPREHLHFDPNDPAACAAIVSCGGICPGLNSVIRELVMTLWDYGVRRIWGIRGGYKGVVDPACWIKLTPDSVKDIHTLGGTVLVSDRGAPPVEDMVKVLVEKKVRQYFVLGGDGTHRGAMESFECCLQASHECAVVGVPKTIDNDVPLLDQTFGFDTACTEAERAVDSAYVEARCNANAIGLVKLMGRHCGFIAMNATLAARHVDICLIPEMDIDLEKVLDHAVHLMKTKKYAVIVVAEGCGDTLIKSSGETDAGGNKVLADAGLFLKDAITARFKKEALPLTIKYIDSTYMIRSVPANAFDSKYCSSLAQNAVHGALAGYSGITVGKVSERYVYLPIHAITQQAGPRVDTSGPWFNRLLETTGQPNFCTNGPAAAPALTEKAMQKAKVLENLSLPSSINLLLEPGDEVRRLDLVKLSESFQSANAVNPINSLRTGEQWLTDDCWTTKTFYRSNSRDDRGHVYYQALLGGPRERLHFDPAKSAAVIVTCGGLCPGLNSVIRELVMTLAAYGVPRIFGCRGGYKGMVQPEEWMELTPETVHEIHMQGGTILVSDRGNPPTEDIANALKSKGITHYFVIGGDGTHRGAMEVFKSTQDIKHECSVVGIPKTIDNDIPILDRSFGFNTACTEAVSAINSAHIEATSNANCIGMVKLMGRHCGWIALEAVLAARHVDVCLLPEMDVSLPKLLTHLRKVMKEQGHAVLVVAEGCGDTLIASSGEKDAGGNKKLADVGPWLQAAILKHFKTMQEPCTIKFIDPTYTIRAVPANANDSVYCSVLAQHAVHGGMAGYTGITVGKVDERYVMLPIHAITTMESSRKVTLRSRTFERMLGTTGQPDLTPGPGDDWALLPTPPPPRDEEAAWEELPELDALEFKRLESDGAVDAQQEQDAAQGATLRVLDGYGDVAEERPLQRSDLMQPSDKLRRLEVMRLSDKSGSKASVKSPMRTLGVSDFIDDDAWAVQALAVTSPSDASRKGKTFCQMLRAGPRDLLYFDPADKDACAAVLTAGGLCPGENAALRMIVIMLHRYGVKRIYGIRNGLQGITDSESWMELTPEVVQGIHGQGGTILRSQRGNPKPEDAAASLKARGVRQFFALGGDGTLRGVLQILTALDTLGHECACLAVPSTINGDIPLSDPPFGFDTACTVARDSITAAYVEATCNANCIGLVKLLGEKNGFLCQEATLASRHVDICLIPEMEIDLEKVLDHCEHIMRTKRYGVVVLAEGCKTCLLKGQDADLDVGIWLRDKILARFKEKGTPLTIKYIDPTYSIRSVSAGAHDVVYCTALAEHAVHGAMAGITGAAVAKVCQRNVYLPLQVISKSPGMRVDVKGRNFARMRATTQQPTFTLDGFDYDPPPDISAFIRSISTPVSLAEVLKSGTEIRRLYCANLSQKFKSKSAESPLKGTALTGSASSAFMELGALCLQTLQNKKASDTSVSYLQLERAGPRETLHFDPAEPDMAAAVVTCGGLCPGLNNVIRELALMLHAYGVKTVYGIRGGYKGFDKEEDWINLTPQAVQDIDMRGGSILVSDRGNPPHERIAEVVRKRNIRQFFVLGGDGTHKGAMAAFQAMTQIGHECAVVGVPKTIDNDIQLLDRSFGFDTACTEAKKAIDSAYVEATTNANCIGLVKLMGRHCGWIAAMASIAAQNVDVCLIPEMKISKDKLLAYVADVMRRQKYAVIVVAEGCGDTIIKGTGEKDAGGNAKLADVGPYLKDELTKHLKGCGIPVSIKYIDPTYMIRAVPANAFDSKYCAALAQEAVHAAMAGYTGITVGKVDASHVMVPIHAITSQGPRMVDLDSRVFARLMATTAQPSFEG